MRVDQGRRLALVLAAGAALPILHGRAQPAAQPHTTATGTALLPQRYSALAAAVGKGGWNTVAIGVIDGGRNAVAGFGRSAGGPVDGRTLYAIGSVTKTFTATLLADAVQRGEVRLEQDVFSLIGQQGQGPQLVELATHTSGLPRLPGNLHPARLEDPYAGYGPAQLEEALRSLQPGARSYLYSNLGYGLLGHALARRAGSSYDQLVRERIAAPLGLRDTGSVVADSDAVRLAQGHGPLGAPVAPWHFDALAGAGALYSSVNDMLLYVARQMKAEPDSVWARLQRVQRDGPEPRTRIAMGWHRTTLPDGRTMVWHNGQTGGHASFAGWMEGAARAVVVLASTARPVDALAVQLLANPVPLFAPQP